MPARFAPPDRALIDRVVVHTTSPNALIALVPFIGPGVTAVPAANLVMYVPFWLPGPTLVTKLYWSAGAVAGNADLGIYDAVGTLMASTGTTVVGNANNIQLLDITDTTLARGNYYFGFVADTVVTLTILCVQPAAGIAQSLGCLEQASVTLPLATNASPATFAVYTRAYIPHVGLQGFRTIGI